MRCYCILITILIVLSRESFCFIASTNSRSRTVAQSMSTEDLQGLLTSTLTHHKNGDLEQAMTGYKTLLDYDLNAQTISTICSNAGAIAMSFGDYSLARDWFKRGVRAMPDNPTTHYNLAITLTSKLYEHEEALKITRYSVRASRVTPSVIQGRPRACIRSSCNFKKRQ